MAGPLKKFFFCGFPNLNNTVCRRKGKNVFKEIICDQITDFSLHVHAPISELPSYIRHRGTLCFDVELRPLRKYSVCPRSSDPFYVVTYYIKWVTTYWTHSKLRGSPI